LGLRWKRTGPQKKLREELHDLYCSPNITGVQGTSYRWTMWHTWERKNGYMVVVAKPEEQRSF
jgi:hypothetical protein